MRVGIYSGVHNAAALALGDGFALAGVEVSHRNVRYYGGEVEDFDVAVTFALREGRAVLARYSAAGRPVLVADWGYLARVNHAGESAIGYWQISLGGLNQIPTFACPPDRFDALGFDMIERGGDHDGYVLVCGQVPGDAAHGMQADEYRAWLADQVGRYENIVYRPHPRGGIDLPGIESDRRSLTESLSGARLVVTYNSNVGHEALMAGVPVVASGPAAYAELVGEALPTVAMRRDYFNRVAYGQWTRDEMRSGLCQRFILDHLLPGKSFGLRDPRDVASYPKGALIVDSGASLRAADDGRVPHSVVATDDGLDAMGADELRALAKDRGVKIHARAGANKIRAALRGA